MWVGRRAIVRTAVWRAGGRRRLACAAARASTSRRFQEASRADSRIETSRALAAEEEQELLWEAPACPAPQLPEPLGPGNAAAALAHMMESGLLRLDGLLLAAEAAALGEHVSETLERSAALVAEGRAPFLDRFGPIMSRASRYDVLLPLDARVLPVAQRILGPLAARLLLPLVGEDAFLCELSALVSDPGSVAQPLHHDTTFDGTPLRVSLLVALQDVTAEMGPTVFFPRTHTAEWHVKYLQRGEDLEDLLESTPHVRGELLAGDAILYDTSLLHLGGANSSQHMRRSLLVLSAQEEDASNRGCHANIQPGYRARFRIAETQQWTCAE